ncbi:cupin domain-containing protein [Natrinema gelatinilyticum]|uniref:cupin domain-containing protein n=1 Tax=Natrinema gelatinilyticum TaxID=2961571 RepID=UPI0020C29080|nr:cupin domain-containing protein [Natrinema gelatinilyticum]
MDDVPYHVIDPDEVTVQPDRPDIEPAPDPIADTYSLSDAANFEIVGIRNNEVDIGEQIPLAYHYHETQEEAFLVRSGTVHVETPEREYVVEAGEMFLVEGGHPHRMFVPADAGEPATVLSFGAPSVDTGQVYDSDDA